MALHLLKSLLSRCSGILPAAAPSAGRQVRKYRPRVEELEPRLVPVTAVTDLNSLTASALVKNLTGKGITVSNVKYTGAKAAGGIFSGGANSVKVASGVVLSSGSAKGVIGPNSTGSSTLDNGTPGDADLDQLVSGGTSFDAAVLEFDFVPKGPQFSFQYVFGSEEYPEFVNASFNDVFGFFVNGKNQALIPGTNTPVSIDNVNAGLNSKFYVDNGSGSFNTQMDAFTRVLPVSVVVTPNKVNHIKLAIQDLGDAAYDSWVLIKAGSLTAPIIKTYRPFRYVYNPNNKTYSGKITVISDTKMKGPLYILFPKLPSGVTVANAHGYTKKGVPYLVISGGLSANKAVRLPIVFKNPKHVNMHAFFRGYPIDVAGAVS